MQKTVYHSGDVTKSGTSVSSTGQMHTVQMAAVKVRQQRRVHKMAPLLLIGCLLLAVLTVLFVPMLVDGAAPVSAPAATTSTVERTVAEYSTLQEAADVLGFTPVWPSVVPPDYHVTNYRVVDGTMLEIVFSSPSESVVFRMAPGSDDLSGISTDYAYTVTETVDGITRSYAGISAQKLNMAVWADDSFSYAVVVTAGIDATQMRAVAESIA